MAENKSHFELSASATDRWSVCHGSKDYIKKFPQEKATKYASEGTAAHDFAANRLAFALGRSDYDPKKLNVGDTTIADGVEFELTEEMNTHIDMYVDYVLGLVKKYSLKPKHIFIEFQVIIKNKKNIPLGGTADCILHVPYDRIIVIDFKYGKGRRVVISGNKQLQSYGLGALSAIKPDEYQELESIEIVVVQPRNGGISSLEMPIEQLEAYYHKLIAWAEKCIPGAPLVAGDHCSDTYCPARGSCPALQKHLDSSVGQKFALVKLKKDLRDIESLTLEEKLKILTVKDDIKDWLDAMFNSVLAEAERGTEIPGWKVVESRTNRKWIDENKAEEFLTALFEDAAYKKKILSPAQAEKLIKSDENIKELELLVEKPKGKNTLAPMVDIRVEQKPKVVKAFEGIKTRKENGKA